MPRPPTTNFKPILLEQRRAQAFGRGCDIFHLQLHMKHEGEDSAQIHMDVHFTHSAARRAAFLRAKEELPSSASYSFTLASKEEIRPLLQQISSQLTDFTHGQRRYLEFNESYIQKLEQRYDHLIAHSEALKNTPKPPRAAPEESEPAWMLPLLPKKPPPQERAIISNGQADHGYSELSHAIFLFKDEINPKYYRVQLLNDHETEIQFLQKKKADPARKIHIYSDHPHQIILLLDKAKPLLDTLGVHSALVPAHRHHALPTGADVPLAEEEEAKQNFLIHYALDHPDRLHLNKNGIGTIHLNESAPNESWQYPRRYIDEVTPEGTGIIRVPTPDGPADATHPDWQALVASQKKRQAQREEQGPSP